MKSYIDDWREITSDPWILDMIQGFPETSVTEPQASSLRHINFDTEEAKLVEAELKKLERKEIIKEVSHEPGEYVSTVFLRPKKDGSHGVILNLKYLNKSVEKNPF